MLVKLKFLWQMASTAELQILPSLATDIAFVPKPGSAYNLI